MAALPARPAQPLPIVDRHPGWIVQEAAAAVALLAGIQQLLAAHGAAVRLSHIPHAPSTEYSGAAHGVSDVVVVVVAGLTLICLGLATSFLCRNRTRPGAAVLTAAFIGSAFLAFDAYSVGRSGWLLGCVSCGGSPQAAQSEAQHALLFLGAAAFLLFIGLGWLRIRDDV